MMCKSGDKGFTLMEVIIAVAIISVIMMTAISAMKMAGDTLAADIMDNMVYSSIEQVAGELCEEMQYAPGSSISVSNDGSWVNFQVPVDLDGDGTVYPAGDTSQPVELGVIHGGVPSSGSTTYRFVSTGSVSEAALSMDLNGNGNMSDSFEVGYMEKVMSDTVSAWSIQMRRGNGFVQPKGALGGDIDGDGQPDPVFAVSGNTVTVNLWSLGVDPRAQPRLASSTAIVCTK